MTSEQRQREKNHCIHGAPAPLPGPGLRHNGGLSLAWSATSMDPPRTKRDPSDRPENPLITTLARIIRVSLKPGFRKSRTASLTDLAAIRKALLLSFEDCRDLPAQRLRLKIENAKSPRELWMLRNDIYQLISQRHNQSVAADRINELVQVFDGWLDPKQITHIK